MSITFLFFILSLVKCITRGYIYIVRIFKNKWFNHWAKKEKITDDALIKAAEDIAAGKVEADLGGSLYKKRLPKAGGGKSGGYRVLVAYRKRNRLFFLYAFGKNQKSNISDKEEIALKLTCKDLLNATNEQISALIEKGSIWEVKNE